ncbi:MAG: hypothetical protein AAB552_01785 [Patescibacteria group bacterium]
MQKMKLWLLAFLVASTTACVIKLPKEVPPEVRVTCVQDGKEVPCPTLPETETTCVVAAGTDTCGVTVTLLNTPAQNIAIGVPRQYLGGYIIDVPNGPTSADTSIFHIRASARSPLSTNVALYNETGAIVAGPVDATRGEGDSEIVTFTDMVTYPKGRHTYVLKGMVSSETSNGTTFTTSFNPSKDWVGVKDQATGKGITLADTLLIMSTVTARGPALSISQSVNPPAHTIVAGTKGVVFAEFQLDASASAEDVRTHSLPLTLNPGPGIYADLSACQLFDGATPINTGSNIVNPYTWKETFIYDSALTVLKGTIKTLRLKCNISSSTPQGSMFTWRISTEQIKAVIATGVASGTNVPVTGIGVSGSTITIGVGSLSVSTSPRSPSYTLVASGSKDVNSGVYRFCGTNEGQYLYQVGLRLASGSPQSLVDVTIWDYRGEGGETLQWGSSIFVGDRLTTTMLLKGSGPWVSTETCKDFTIRATLSDTGLGYPGIEGAFIRIEIDPETTFAIGDSSGLVTNVVGYTETAGYRMFKSFPTVALEPLNATSLADGSFIQFKVMADWHGDVALRHMSFSISCTGLEIKDVALFAYSDQSYTTPIYGVVEGNLTGTIKLGPSTNSVGLYFGLPPVTVPAGGAYYFRLKGTVVPKEVTYACVTKLLGDPRFSSSTGAENFALGTVNDVLGTTMSGFIWNTVGNTDDNDPRWTNGVGVLPADGLFQTRSN